MPQFLDDLIKKLPQGFIDTIFEAPERAVLGQTLNEASQTKDPLYRSFGSGSAHHGELSEVGARRFGTGPALTKGYLIEEAEGVNPSAHPITVGDEPQLENKGVGSYDSLKDMMANVVGAKMGARTTSVEHEAEKADLLNRIIPLTQRLPGIDGEMSQKDKNLDTGEFVDRAINPDDVEEAQDFLRKIFGKTYGPQKPPNVSASFIRG